MPTFYIQDILKHLASIICFTYY